jgi:hypothetical protein
MIGDKMTLEFAQNDGDLSSDIISLLLQRSVADPVEQDILASTPPEHSCFHEAVGYTYWRLNMSRIQPEQGTFPLPIIRKTLCHRVFVSAVFSLRATVLGKECQWH